MEEGEGEKDVGEGLVRGDKAGIRTEIIMADTRNPGQRILGKGLV